MPGTISPNAEDFAIISSILDRSKFEIPVNQPSNQYFPDFLQLSLYRFINYYSSQLKPRIDETIAYSYDARDAIEEKIYTLATGIIAAVEFYYRGDLRHASETFDKTLDAVYFTKNTNVETLPATTRLYRTRPSNGRRFKRKDLFHNPFENRHLVATSRYSIPGLPALYLGSSVYVCWEEFNQIPIKDLYFSQFRSNRDMKVVKIQRLDDLLTTLTTNELDPLKRTSYLLRYLSLFPLTVACSIRTREITGSFKPEYIIPQLLLQYVAKNKSVDGIMFPSTKVDYNTIDGVSAYNYVFPVKCIASSGFCSELMDAFVLTEPTSIELESLLNFSNNFVTTLDRFYDIPGRISLVEGESTVYRATAFGRIEDILNTRVSASLQEL